MKKFSLLLFAFFAINQSFSQGAHPITNEPLRRGVYYSFEEFLKNRPGYTIRFQ